MNPMRTASLTLLLVLAACGGSKKPADSPENAEENGSSETPSSEDGGTAALGSDNGAAGGDTASAPSGPAAPGDDAAKKSSPCGGFQIDDLASVLGQDACVDAKANPNEQKDVKDQLEIKVVPDSPRIAPGSTATITVTFKNKGKADLPLSFVVDPEPRFDFEVYTLKGSRADAPKGSAPSLPPEVANGAPPDSKIARVTLPQQGTARLTLKWNAVKYKWASKERAKGAIPGRGYPKEAAGPLPKGKYILRVITPLTGVFEGVDHDVSQPRIEITVGGMP